MLFAAESLEALGHSAVISTVRATDHLPSVRPASGQLEIFRHFGQ